ncbi:MAG: choice-of-anchor I family protein [Desulfobacterium sp.]
MKKQRLWILIVSLLLTGLFLSSCNDSTNNYHLSVVVDGNGSVSSSPLGIDCGDSCETSFESDSTITLTAEPAEGSYFVGWNGGNNTVDFQITLTETTTVTAQFEPVDPADTVSLKKISTYATGLFDESAAEISAFDPKTQRLFVVNANSGRIDVLDVGQGLTANTEIDLSAHGAGANSVAFNNDVLAVAVEAEDKQSPGKVLFFNADGTLLNSVDVGALPDMVIFTPDGTKVLVANEGEPNNDYTNDPEGSVSVIDISGGIGAATVTTAGFTAFNNEAASLMEKGIRIFGPNASLAQDMEPEYIAVSPDSTIAWVSCQENNAIAQLDLASATITAIFPLGFKDHNLPGNGMDVSNKDDDINIAPWPVLGMYQPDAIASFSINGTVYLISANEGDSRDYDAFGEEERVEDITLDETAYSDAATLQMKENLGRLKITTTLGDTDKDGDFDQLYSYGTRSFSIWMPTPDGMELIFDSGDNLEQIIAAQMPELFNASNDDNEFDDRSDDKGPEPEGVTVGVIQGHTYAFIGLERVGGIMVYDISDPKNPQFIEYINNRDVNGDPESGTAGDLGPEGLLFIPADQSPTNTPLLMVTNEVSGTTTMYEITKEKNENVSFAVFSDPHYYDSDLGVTGSAFESYLAQDRKMLAESEAILAATVKALEGNSHLSFVIVSGDLTKDGELFSHQEFAGYMAQLEQSGIEVFVVPGNHDINNPHANSYDGDVATSVDTVTPDEFAQIYADFGFNQALQRDLNSLSYMAEPVEGIYLLALDSCNYDDNIANGTPETGGSFSQATLTWIAQMLEMASSQNKKVIATMHHGLLEHYSGQSTDQLGKDYVVADYQTVSQALASNGLGMVFTGHYHAQDIVSSSDGKLLDVETGSLVTYPSPYRIVTIKPDNSTIISSSYITDIDYDTGDQNFSAYAREYLHDGLVTIADAMLTAPADMGGFGMDEVTSSVVSLQVAQAYMAHYTGDERPDSTTSASIDFYLESEDPTTQYLGQMLNTLWTDLLPSDNTYVTELP